MALFKGFLLTRALFVATTAQFSGLTLAKTPINQLSYVNHLVRHSQCLSTNYGFIKPHQSQCSVKKQAFSSNGADDLTNELTWVDVGTDELKNMLSNQNIQLIDVREPYELIEDGRIPNSINIPYSFNYSPCQCRYYVYNSSVDQVGEALSMTDKDFQTQFGASKPSVEDTNIIFHCRSGIRSRTALDVAHQLGFIKARHYYPGYLGWEEFHNCNNAKGIQTKEKK